MFVCAVIESAVMDILKLDLFGEMYRAELESLAESCETYFFCAVYVTHKVISQHNPLHNWHKLCNLTQCTYTV